MIRRKLFTLTIFEISKIFLNLLTRFIGRLSAFSEILLNSVGRKRSEWI